MTPIEVASLEEPHAPQPRPDRTHDTRRHAMNESPRSQPPDAQDGIAVLYASLTAFMSVAHAPALLVQRLAEHAAEALTAACVVGLRDDAGRWSEVAAIGPSAKEPAALGLARLERHAGAVEMASSSGRTVRTVAPARDAAEAPAILCLPLPAATGITGVALLSKDTEAGEFTDRDVVLAQHLVEQAGMALQYGRALTAAQHELAARQRLAERHRALAQASRDFVAAAPVYTELLQVIARSVGELLGEVCSVRLVSRDRAWLRVEDAAVFHRDPDVASAFRKAMLVRPQRVGEGLIGRVVESGEPLLQAVVEQRALASSTLPEYRFLLEKVQVSSLMLVPILSRGRCLGALSLSRGPGSPAYDALDLSFAQELADRAALAVENALLLTDLEQRLGEIKKGEEKFRQLLESAPDAIVIVDRAGQIVLINAETEALFGYSRRELLGCGVETLIPGAYRAHHPKLRAGYFDSPRPRHAMAAGLTLYGLRKDGSEFPAEISLSPIATPDGQLVTAVIRDVTERKRLEEARARSLELETQNRRVQEASRLKSEFLANMSHELRTPLNAVIGFSALLHAGKAGPLSDTQREYLGDILVSSRHLLQLINDVLDLAKVEAGRNEVAPQLVDLARLAGEVRDIVRGFAAEKGIDITLGVSPGLERVSTDPRLLKQVLYNYLSNAIKFSPEGGAVQLRIEGAPAGFFTVSVRDNGIGIREEDVHRLFQEFQQLDSGAAKKYPGTGLGLALTKRIVEAQGGRVGVESKPGAGSVFYAVLPTSPSPALEGTDHE